METYTRKTFSAQRYEIWTMQSAYHNLPTINGVMQKDGREFAARDVRYRADERIAELSMDIAAAYPKEAGAVDPGGGPSAWSAGSGSHGDGTTFGYSGRRPRRNGRS